MRNLSTNERVTRGDLPRDAYSYLKIHQGENNIFSLFLMMGLNWYLEITSSLVFDNTQDGIIIFVLDSVNMLQGVWVFGNFICQRNIKDALSKILTRSTFVS